MGDRSKDLGQMLNDFETWMILKDEAFAVKFMNEIENKKDQHIQIDWILNHVNIN